MPILKIKEMMTDSIRMMWLAHHKVMSYRTLNCFRVTPHTAALVQADENMFSFVRIKSIGLYNEGLDQNYQALYEKLVQAEILPRLKEEDNNVGLTIAQLTHQ